MIKNITVGDREYTVTDEETYSTDEKFIFELKDDEGSYYVVGSWYVMRNEPVVKIWKIKKIVDKV